MSRTTQRILFITLSNIGDALMTTPALETLHRRYPTARIDLVADRRSDAIFHHCPYLEHIFYKDKTAGTRGLLKLIAQLRKQRYDLIVDLRTDGLAYLLRARRRLTKWHARPLGAHAVEQHMGVLAALGPLEIPPMRIWLTDELQTQAQQQLATQTSKTWLALGPGANWEPKIWPAARYRELANSVQTHFDGVLLLGGPGDIPRCTEVANGLQLPTLNVAGKTDLLQAAALLAQTRLFVGNDSGLGHLAAAVGRPTLTVFGPGQPQRYRPWGAASHWLTSAEADLTKLSVATVRAELIAMLTTQQQPG